LGSQNKLSNIKCTTILTNSYISETTALVSKKPKIFISCRSYWLFVTKTLVTYNVLHYYILLIDIRYDVIRVFP